ncbi:hypothetical protein FRC03_009757 [Tulasnella sp. 419]|nr:hypothetical protein FRC02_011459 [Tulasnella sp. 418]KAG8957848.1 hypothetical protein FRC03_009757 [Tulasnella sp. 419]
MSNLHIVVFKYKPSTSSEDKLKVANDFLALKDACKLVGSSSPYISSIRAGSNYSEEGFHKGFEHAFVVEFRNEEERQYYLSEDPAHASFKLSIGQLVEDIFVFDFKPGVF